MPPAARNLVDEECVHAYLEGRAAVTFRSPDLLNQINNGKTSEKISKTTGIAIQPGVPFVGGSNLVIWKHIQPAQEAAAVKLVRFLTSSENMMTQFKQIGYVPANLDALNQVEQDPTYVPLTQSLKIGRALQRVPLWGLVEDRLVKAFNHIWQVIFSTPDPDVD
jgi:ABC-type glycerol-3-phosphate transport system substrate-binding protein